MFQLFGYINMWPWQCPNVSKLLSLFLRLWLCMCVLSLQPTLQTPKCQVPHRQRSKYGVSLRFEQRTVNDVLYKVRCSYSYENMKWNGLWGFKADSPVWFIGPVEVMRLMLRPFPAAMITLLNTCVRTALQAEHQRTKCSESLLHERYACSGGRCNSEKTVELNT